MIIDWKNLEIAEFISPEGLDLIRRLLDSNPNERYCYERMKLIKNHPYFNNIDWENCRKRPNPYLRSYVKILRKVIIMQRKLKICMKKINWSLKRIWPRKF